MSRLTSVLKIGFAVLGLVISQSTLTAQVPYRLEDFEPKGTVGGLGYTNINGNPYARAALNPELNWGPFSTGFDLNYYIPMNGNASSFANVVFRHAAFDWEEQHGIKWGRLTGVTFGQGLLMDNYDTGGGGSAEFTPEKTGVLGYTTWKPVQLKAMRTAQGLYAGRITFQHDDSFILGAPIVFGATYVNDEVRNSQIKYGYSGDVSVPIGGEFFTLYTEYARLSNEGDGIGSGFRGDFLGMFNYRLEYRDFQSNFIPSLYSSVYEAASSIKSNKTGSRLSGILGSAGASFFDGYFKTGLKYEKYGDVDLLTASAGWKPIANTVGVINYIKPFKGVTSELDVDILMSTQGGLEYVLSYKKSDGGPMANESYNIAFRTNLSHAFGLPF